MRPAERGALAGEASKGPSTLGERLMSSGLPTEGPSSVTWAGPTWTPTLISEPSFRYHACAVSREDAMLPINPPAGIHIALS